MQNKNNGNTSGHRSHGFGFNSQMEAKFYEDFSGQSKVYLPVAGKQANESTVVVEFRSDSYSKNDYLSKVQLKYFCYLIWFNTMNSGTTTRPGQHRNKIILPATKGS